MRIRVLAFLGILATVLAVTYIYGRTRRYDVVAAEGNAYLIDHWTGRVWFLQETVKLGIQDYSCGSGGQKCQDDKSKTK